MNMSKVLSFCHPRLGSLEAATQAEYRTTQRISYSMLKGQSEAANLVASDSKEMAGALLP